MKKAERSYVLVFFGDFLAMSGWCWERSLEKCCNLGQETVGCKLEGNESCSRLGTKVEGGYWDFWAARDDASLPYSI